MRIAVTGGTGFIGRRVVRDLRAQGHDVVCVVRRPGAASALASLGAELVQGDLLDRASLARAFAGAEAVFHLAASYEIGLHGEGAERALRMNVEGTRHALEAAVESGARKVVYTSSIAVNGTTAGEVVDESFRYGGAYFASHYSRSKHLAHYDVALPLVKAGAPIVILQPGVVLGPGDASNFASIFRFMAWGVPLPLGHARYAMVGVDDCARAHLLALERGRIGESYYVVSENLSLRELAQRAERVSGVPARALVLPDGLLKACAAVMGLVERIVPVPMVLSRESMLGQCGDVTMTVHGDKARAELGFVPRPLDGTLRAILVDELTRRRRPLTLPLERETPPAAQVPSVPPPA